MEKFFFTYDVSGHPFSGGWTEIEAPDRTTAIALFRTYHPDKVEGLLNCRSVYEAHDFYKTDSFKHGRCSKRCVERICVTRNVNISEKMSTDDSSSKWWAVG